MKGPRMPSTKLLVSLVAYVAGNIVITVGANTDVWAPVPDPWRTVIVTLVAALAGWVVRARHLAPSEIELARSIGDR